jgi:endonuclease/exonuclease/phosphatase family metal-dependent hydrolase
MTRIRASLALFLLLCSTLLVCAAETGSLKVMSYNLRYASSSGANTWPERRPVMANLLRQTAPDVMGTQEGLYQQIRELASDLPDHDWIGLGREGGSKSEFMAVFYRTARLEPVAFDHFWLSDTPEVVGSSTWGNSNKRMVTWVQFRDRQTRQQFCFVNTHFDHEIQLARERSAELLRARVEKLNSSLPVILTGDFNCTTNNKAYQVLVGSGFFQDTWYKAVTRRGEGLGTFNGFKAIPRDNSRIDWILTRGDFRIIESEIVTQWQDKQFASDHFPITATLVLPK